MEKSIYSELEKIVSPALNLYKTDLTKHDKNTLSEYSGPFIYGYRPTGTSLMELRPNATVKDFFTEQYFNRKVDFRLHKSKLIEQFSAEMKHEIIWITGLENKKFLYYDGSKLIPKTREEICQLWEQHVEKIISLLSVMNEGSETLIAM